MGGPHEKVRGHEILVGIKFARCVVEDILSLVVRGLPINPSMSFLSSEISLQIQCRKLFIVVLFIITKTKK